MALHPLIQAALLSMFPFAELRGGIPVAIAQGVHPLTAAVVCVVANLLVTPILFFFLEFIHHRLVHIKAYAKAADRALHLARRRTHRFIERWGPLGLALFVAVPLPVTGAYTATLAAWVLGVEFKKTILAVLIGLIISATIVTIATLGVINFIM